jgi:hypothetical protein
LLLLYGIGQCFVFETSVLGEPLLQLDNFERVRGSRQHLREQLVWIKRNGCDQ